MRWLAALFLIATGLIFSAAPAQAWGGSGHQIVCEIAYRNLTSTARAEVDRLFPNSGRSARSPILQLSGSTANPGQPTLGEFRARPGRGRRAIRMRGQYGRHLHPAFIQPRPRHPFKPIRRRPDTREGHVPDRALGRRRSPATSCLARRRQRRGRHSHRKWPMPPARRQYEQPAQGLGSVHYRGSYLPRGDGA